MLLVLIIGVMLVFGIQALSSVVVFLCVLDLISTEKALKKKPVDNPVDNPPTACLTCGLLCYKRRHDTMR